MSSHADTIPRLRRYLDMTLLEPTRMDYLDALDALLAENQRLRETLERIATGSRKGQYIEEWDGYSIRLPKVVEIAREALAGDTE